MEVETYPGKKKLALNLVMKVAEFFPIKSNLDAQPEACSQHVVESLLKLNTFSH